MAKIPKIKITDIDKYEKEALLWVSSKYLLPTNPTNEKSIAEILINYKNYPISDLHRHLWLWDHIDLPATNIERSLDSFSNDEFLLITKLFLVYLIFFPHTQPPSLRWFFEHLILKNEKESDNE